MAKQIAIRPNYILDASSGTGANNTMAGEIIEKYHWLKLLLEDNGEQEARAWAQARAFALFNTHWGSMDDVRDVIESVAREVGLPFDIPIEYHKLNVNNGNGASSEAMALKAWAEMQPIVEHYAKTSHVLDLTATLGNGYTGSTTILPMIETGLKNGCLVNPLIIKTARNELSAGRDKVQDAVLEQLYLWPVWCIVADNGYLADEAAGDEWNNKPVVEGYKRIDYAVSIYKRWREAWYAAPNQVDPSRANAEIFNGPGGFITCAGCDIDAFSAENREEEKQRALHFLTKNPFVIERFSKDGEKNVLDCIEEVFTGTLGKIPAPLENQLMNQLFTQTYLKDVKKPLKRHHSRHGTNLTPRAAAVIAAMTRRRPGKRKGLLRLPPREHPVAREFRRLENLSMMSLKARSFGRSRAAGVFTPVALDESQKTEQLNLPQAYTFEAKDLDVKQQLAQEKFMDEFLDKEIENSFSEEVDDVKSEEKDSDDSVMATTSQESSENTVDASTANVLDTSVTPKELPEGKPDLFSTEYWNCNQGQSQVESVIVPKPVPTIVPAKVYTPVTLSREETKSPQITTPMDAPKPTLREKAGNVKAKAGKIWSGTTKIAGSALTSAANFFSWTKKDEAEEKPVAEDELFSDIPKMPEALKDSNLNETSEISSVIEQSQPPQPTEQLKDLDQIAEVSNESSQLKAPPQQQFLHNKEAMMVHIVVTSSEDFKRELKDEGLRKSVFARKPDAPLKIQYKTAQDLLNIIGAFPEISETDQDQNTPFSFEWENWFIIALSGRYINIPPSIIVGDKMITPHTPLIEMQEVLQSTTLSDKDRAEVATLYILKRGLGKRFVEKYISVRTIKAPSVLRSENKNVSAVVATVPATSTNGNHY